jgi:hypothetical protein
MNEVKEILIFCRNLPTIKGKLCINLIYSYNLTTKSASNLNIAKRLA